MKLCIFFIDDPNQYQLSIQGRHYTLEPFSLFLSLSLPSIYFFPSNKTATITIANTSTTNKTNSHHIHIPSNADTDKHTNPCQSSQVRSSRIATSFTIHAALLFSGLFWYSFHLYMLPPSFHVIIIPVLHTPRYFLFCPFFLGFLIYFIASSSVCTTKAAVSLSLSPLHSFSKYWISQFLSNNQKERDHQQ